MKKFAIGIDIGGTNTKIGLVNIKERRVIGTRIIDTISENKRDCLDRIVNQIHNLLDELFIDLEELNGIGVGILGPVLEQRYVVPVRGFHWDTVIDLVEAFKIHFDLPVQVENDVNLVSYGEFMILETDDVRNIVTIAIGTDIGAGIIIDGKIYCGRDGTAGEIAHCVIDPTGKSCECGRKGCISLYCGGENVSEAFKQNLRNKDYTTYQGVLIDSIDMKTIFDFAKAKDVLAEKAIDEFTAKLSQVIININNSLNPDMIVIAGGVSLSGEYFLTKLIDECGRLKTFDGFIKEPRIQLSQLGNEAGILGAALITC